ncbi:MAG: GreA/GreB family elongation factor [Flavobacteriaceae bacterium]|nr:GreA/GreB family elongation factor [Flavobacteriaceae bacterium]
MQERKKAIYDRIVAQVESRLEIVQKRFDELQHALNSETKSTAGDKHETGRAMVQLEMEKTGTQLAKAENELQLLQKLPLEATNKIALGSLVKTDNAWYFLSISIGILTFESQAYYVISPVSPIGQLLLGKSIGAEFSFRGKTECILGIF